MLWVHHRVFIYAHSKGGKATIVATAATRTHRHIFFHTHRHTTISSYFSFFFCLPFSSWVSVCVVRVCHGGRDNAVQGRRSGPSHRKAAKRHASTDTAATAVKPGALSSRVQRPGCPGLPTLQGPQLAAQVSEPSSVPTAHVRGRPLPVRGRFARAFFYSCYDTEGKAIMSGTHNSSSRRSGERTQAGCISDSQHNSARAPRRFLPKRGCHDNTMPRNRMDP